jgi:hypothetical protein
MLPIGDGEMMMGVQKTMEHGARNPRKHGDTATRGCTWPNINQNL